MQPQNFTYSSISCFKQRPSANIRYLISRQLPKLVDIAISQAVQFVNTGQTKIKALKQLKYTVLIAEGHIAKHLEKIIKALVKIWQLDIDNVEKTIKEIMSIVGFHVKSNYYLPLMMNILTEDEIKNSARNTIILLKMISFMLLTSEDIEEHLDEIIRLVSTYQQLFLENDEGLATVCEIASTLAHRLSNLDHPKLVSTIFSVFLNVEATKTLTADYRHKVREHMGILAKKAGYASVPELHSQEVGPVLARIIDNKQYTAWTKTSKNRFKFDTIVRNCEGEAIRFLPSILTVLEYCISLQCDIEIRMDTLVLLQQMLANEQVRCALKPYADRVYLQVLNVAIKWKVGKPQIKIRKGGVVNMIKMIELQVINQSQLLDCLNQVLPQIKSCISDDWAPELRFACCEFLERYLLATKHNITGDQLRELYVILLQRLDDSQDDIRKKTTCALNIFFLCRYLPLYTSFRTIMQYMVSAIFIHYDDNNEQIRQAVNVTLRYAARIDPEQVLKQAQAGLGKMRNRGLCGDLIEYAREVLEDRSV